MTTRRIRTRSDRPATYRQTWDPQLRSKLGMTSHPPGPDPALFAESPDHLQPRDDQGASRSST